MISVAALRAMAKAGATVEVIIDAIEAEQVQQAEADRVRREKNAARVRNWRQARNACNEHKRAQTSTNEHKPLHIQDVVPSIAAVPQDVASDLVRGLFDKTETALSCDSQQRSTEQVRKKEREEATKVIVEGRKRRRCGVPLPPEWAPSEKHAAEARALGKSLVWLHEQESDMRLWAISNEHREVARKSNWDTTFSGWMRREAKRGNSNGQHGNGLQDSGPGGFARNAVRFARAARDRADQGPCPPAFDVRPWDGSGDS